MRPIRYPNRWPRNEVARLVAHYAEGTTHSRVVNPLSRLRHSYFVNETQPRRVMDLGCGQCYTLAHLFDDHLPPEGIVGVEMFNPPQLDVPGDFSLYWGDMHEVRKATVGDFDLVLGAHSGYRSPDPERLFAAVFDVLRPGGAAYIDFWTDELVKQSGVAARSPEDRRTFLRAINDTGQTIRPCPDPRPFDEEVALIRNAATASGLQCAILPFFGRRALRLAYGSFPEIRPQKPDDAMVVAAIVEDPTDAQDACGYFTAALHREG